MILRWSFGKSGPTRRLTTGPGLTPDMEQAMPKVVRNYTPPQSSRSRQQRASEISGRLVLLREWLGLSQQEMQPDLG